MTNHRVHSPQLHYFPGALRVTSDTLEAVVARRGKTGMVGYGGASA